MKTRKLRPKLKKALIILLVVVCLLTGLSLFLCQNPRIKMFIATMHFMQSTLEDPGYLLHDVDIMELCDDYLNGDTAIKGTTSFSKMKQCKSSIYFNVEGFRSFEQSKAAIYTNMDLLWLTIGRLNLFAENETVYLDAPLLGTDIGYAFPTGHSFFSKAPDFTHDIDQEWFHENLTNIVQFMSQISIAEKGDYLDYETGRKSTIYHVILPQGCGDFIWELLGMEGPDYDVEYDIYIDRQNHISRIEMDLSNSIEGAYVILDGTSLGTLYFYYDLPESERMEMTMVRNPNFKHRIDIDTLYFTNTDKTYECTCYMTWENKENGFSMKVKDIIFTEDTDFLGEGFFIGSVEKTNLEDDLFKNRADFLYNLESLDWYEVRDNSEQFINDVLSKTNMAAFF